MSKRIHTQKSAMTVDGNSVHMSMPFAKVNKEERLVSGYATLDNIDTQGDVVLAEASAKAFARARGNIREMHQPLAVGKMVDFQEHEFFDNENGNLYRGIFVTVHVSKGAQSTWEKVLDGTLTGFSIGGEIIEASNDFVKEAGKTVRFIKAYDLTELSLVDNPANQLSNVVSIQKSATGSVTVKMGEVTDTVVENVFVCSNDETVVVKDAESQSCPECGTKMENAGWFESGSDKTEKVKSIVAKFLNPTVEEAAPISSEGGDDMFKNKDKGAGDGFPETDPVPEGKPVKVVNPGEEWADNGEKVEDSVKEVDAADAPEVEETAPETDETATPDEVVDAETDISKKIDEFKGVVVDELEKTRDETKKQVDALEKKLETATDSFLAKAAELEETMNKFGDRIDVQKNRLNELASSLEKFNSADAFKKSADVRTAAKTSQEGSFWGPGTFSGKK